MLKNLIWTSCLCSALSLTGQEVVGIPTELKAKQEIDRAWHGSVGLGNHKAGLLTTLAVTGPGRWGAFAGYASSSRSDGDLPPRSTDPVATFAPGPWFKRETYHVGVAYRANSTVTFGFGYGQMKTDYVYQGWSYLQNRMIRNGNTDTEQESGPMGMLEFGMSHGVGLQLVGGSYASGISVLYRW